MIQISSVRSVFNDDVVPNGNYNTGPQEVEKILSVCARAVYRASMNQCFKNQRITQKLIRILIGEKFISYRQVQRACQELRQLGYARCSIYQDKSRPRTYVGRQWHFFSASQNQNPEEVARLGAENAPGIAIVNAKGAGVPCDPVARAVEKDLVITRRNYCRKCAEDQDNKPKKSKAKKTAAPSQEPDPVIRPRIHSEDEAYLSYKIDTSPNPSQAPAEHREEEKDTAGPSGRVFKTLPPDLEEKALSFGFDRSVSIVPGPAVLNWLRDLKLNSRQEQELHEYFGLTDAPDLPEAVAISKAADEAFKRELEDDLFMRGYEHRMMTGQFISRGDTVRRDALYIASVYARTDMPDDIKIRIRAMTLEKYFDDPAHPLLQVPPSRFIPPAPYPYDPTGITRIQ